MDKHRETPQPTRNRIARTLLRNSPGLIYLIWVAVTTVAVVHSLVTWDQPDANMAAVLTFVQTLPWSLLVGFTPVLPASLTLAFFIVIVVAGALANAMILNWLGRTAVHLAVRSFRYVRGRTTLTA